MRTVVIVHHTGEWGGGTKSLIDLCEMLREDYKVIVCIPSGFPDFSNKIAQYECCLHELTVPLPFINLYSGRPPLMSVVTLKSIISLGYIKSAGDEIMALKPDIVIFNSLITAVTAIYLSKFTKVICTDRETIINPFDKFLYRALLDKHLDAITFLADYERKKMNFQHAEAFLFPDCIKLDTLSSLDRECVREREGIASDKYVILFMGGLAKIKGTDVILEALDSLDDRFLLIFAGVMNAAKLSKRQLLHDIKYPSHYRFKKRVIKHYNSLIGSSKLYEAGLRDSIDEMIIASDIIVFPSTSVHQPRPCIEAGAYGKPVILSDYKETNEYFRDGFNALLFRPRDVSDLTEKIRYAYDHRNEMIQLGNKNRRMTEMKHNFYDCKAVICSVIEKVCGNED